jgi:hypothetical protein
MALIWLGALLLVACGNLTSGGTGATTEKTSAPTQTDGPVTIATDHSVYNGLDTIKVIITNHLSSMIYAYDTQASCSILSLEVQQNGLWVASNALRCPLGRVALAVDIKPGANYTANVGGSVMRLGTSAALANGTYRLVLRYFSAPVAPIPTPSDAPLTPTVVDSAPLTFSGSVASDATRYLEVTSQPNQK